MLREGIEGLESFGSSYRESTLILRGRREGERHRSNTQTIPIFLLRDCDWSVGEVIPSHSHSHGHDHAHAHAHSHGHASEAAHSHSHGPHSHSSAAELKGKKEKREKDERKFTEYTSPNDQSRSLNRNIPPPRNAQCATHNLTVRSRSRDARCVTSAAFTQLPDWVTS
eukprot:9142305-Pyramimonas_sp.AAC.1